MEYITAERFNKSTDKTKDTIKRWWEPKIYDLAENTIHGLSGPITNVNGNKLMLSNVGYVFYKSETVPLLTIDQLISFIRGHAQMDIYTVDEEWYLQLFDLNDAANDIDVSCIWESGAKTLIEVLFAAVEYICNELIYG